MNTVTAFHMKRCEAEHIYLTLSDTSLWSYIALPALQQKKYKFYYSNFMTQILDLQLRWNITNSQ
jgi:hypothetical protein